MSEKQRTALYTWLREQTDNGIAEYVMSRLPPAPVSDLVTTPILRAMLSEMTAAQSKEFAKFATRDDLAELRAEGRKRFRWGMAVGVTLFGILIATTISLFAVMQSAL